MFRLTPTAEELQAGLLWVSDDRLRLLLPDFGRELGRFEASTGRLGGDAVALDLFGRDEPMRLGLATIEHEGERFRVFDGAELFAALDLDAGDDLLFAGSGTYVVSVERGHDRDDAAIAASNQVLANAIFDTVTEGIQAWSLEMLVDRHAALIKTATPPDEISRVVAADERFAAGVTGAIIPIECESMSHADELRAKAWTQRRIELAQELVASAEASQEDEREAARIVEPFFKP